MLAQKEPSTSPKTSASKHMMSATDYSKRTQHEQILKAPDTYIGSIEPQEEIIAVMGKDDLFENKVLTIVPGFYKIFDEIIVNAADNKVRFPEMDTIKVTLDADGRITVWNNGRGIPVEKHPEYKVYAPELIFGHLLTSSNYDKSGKLTGGKNGLGAKLTNIYSQEFTVETVDHQRGLKFKQTWRNNMLDKETPKVTSAKSVKSDYTCVSFLPDYQRFGLNGLDEGHRQLFERRIYDLAATTPGCKVFLNGERIKIKNFKDYIRLYVGKDLDILYETVADNKGLTRWEIAVVPNPQGQFQQVSFVNSIFTKNGGTHVNYLCKQITQAISEKLEKMKTIKSGMIKPFTIKNQLWLFVNCRIEDPSFSSQVKEEMTSIVSKWGSVPSLSKMFYEKLLKSAIVSSTLEDIETKQTAMLKKMDGSKKSTVSGIDKLKDAEYAGTRHAHRCTLFLTEGDSAKSMAISGLSALTFEDRKYYGVYPLRGKVLNVRDASVKQILENKEISELKKILGLQQNKDYTDVKSLRYGRVALFTDADADGAHIKGLVINFFDHFYPSLLKMPKFLFEFITPIVKCMRNGHATMTFYNLQEYEEWCSNTNTKAWKIKYYKGLGTSTTQEAKAYFAALNHHLKSYRELDDADREQLDMVFRKKRAEDRKTWLSSYNPKAFLDRSQGFNSICEFIDAELIHFSHYDNIRSIPRLMDGLKPSQRKVLYTLLKYPLAEGNEIKVAQLASKVAEKTEYHHGEVSLSQTIINLAQSFVGSNNLPLLYDGGQFGTRLQGGSDAASPRYIFTRLLPYVKLLFKDEDMALLKKQYEDNSEIEPEYFMPTIPLVLVNGAKGIGSGYSTDIPCYNPLDLIAALKRRLSGQDPLLNTLVPFYNGFRGTIVRDESAPDKYLHRGAYRYYEKQKVLLIYELPVGTWTESYAKKVLDPLVASATSIIDGTYKDNSTESAVHFEIPLKKTCSTEDILQHFELQDSFRTSNMVLFDDQFRIKRYANVDEIFNEFYQVRYVGYQQRKDHLLQQWERELSVLDNKKRFIEGVLSGDIDIRFKDDDTITALLLDRGLSQQDNSFGYLLSLPMRSMTKERVLSLQKEHAEKSARIQVLRGQSVEDLWLEDLTALETALRHVIKALPAAGSSSGSSSAGSGTAAARCSSTARSKRTRSDEGTKRVKNETKRSKLAST